MLPGRPRNDEEKATDFIQENKIFEIQPHAGTLQARGSKATVTFTFRPSHAGRWKLPAFLRVLGGKRLQLVLHGETASQEVPRLLSTPAQRTLTFEPTPIGEASPPLHTFLLRNGGFSDVSFSLDLAAVKQLAQDSWGFEVIRLRSEASGTVPDQGVLPLNWLFAPLEAREYTAVVPVRLSDGSAELVTLQGRGFHPSEPSAGAPMAGEGSRDWATWSGFSTEPSVGLEGGRLATLCHDVVSLGTTLPLGLTRRILVLSNTSEYPITFEWDLGIFAPQRPAVAGQGSAVQAGLTVSPPRGQLEPGEQCVCRVALEAGITPQLFEAEVRCRVAVDEESAFRHAAEALREQEARDAAAALDYTDTGSVIEEVIFESPNRNTKAAAARARLTGTRPRLPVHLYMTAAIRGRIQALDEQFSRTIEAMSRRLQATGAAATAAPELPEPQVIAVGLTGRILTAAQIKAGSFIPRHELDAARLLLEGAAWSAPSEAPFWAPPLAGEPESAEGPSEEEALDGEIQSRARAVLSEAKVAALKAEQRAGQPEEEEESRPEEEASEEALAEEVQAAARGLLSRERVEGLKARPPAEGGAVEDERLLDEEGDATQQQRRASGAAPTADLPGSTSAGVALPPPAAAPAPAAAEPAPGALAASRALTVLRGALAEAMDPARLSPLVEAWRCLRPGRVPAFAELREQVPEAFRASAQEEAAPILDEAVEEGEEKLLRDGQFHAFAEYVLENALVGLVSESCSGEWQPPPATSREN